MHKGYSPFPVEISASGLGVALGLADHLLLKADKVVRLLPWDTEDEAGFCSAWSLVWSLFTVVCLTWPKLSLTLLKLSGILEPCVVWLPSKPSSLGMFGGSLVIPCVSSLLSVPMDVPCLPWVPKASFVTWFVFSPALVASVWTIVPFGVLHEILISVLPFTSSGWFGFPALFLFPVLFPSMYGGLTLFLCGLFWDDGPTVLCLGTFGAGKYKMTIYKVV